MSRSVRQAYPTSKPQPVVQSSPAAPATRVERCGNLEVHIPIKENQK